MKRSSEASAVDAEAAVRSRDIHKTFGHKCPKCGDYRSTRRFGPWILMCDPCKKQERQALETFVQAAAAAEAQAAAQAAAQRLLSNFVGNP